MPGSTVLPKAPPKKRTIPTREEIELLMKKRGYYGY
jgi:hypothetical protein